MCEHPNNADESHCYVCGASKLSTVKISTIPTVPESWTCNHCTHENRSDAVQCFECGALRFEVQDNVIPTPKFSAPRLEVLHKKIVDLLMSEQNKITLAEGIGLLEIVKADLITQALEAL